MRRIKLILFVVFFSLILPSVISTSYIEYTFTNAQGQVVTNVKLRGYVCSNSACSSIISNGNLWDGNIVSSGGSNKIIVEFPGSIPSGGTGYLIKFFHDEYLQRYLSNIRITDDYGYTSSSNAYKVTLNSFNQEPDCSSPVSLSVVDDTYENLPITLQSSTNLSTTTASAFDYTLNGHYSSPDILDFYKVETTLNLTIYKFNPDNQQTVDDPVHNQEVVERIYYDDTVDVEFDDWTPPEAGYYKIMVESIVTDAKCSSQITQSDSQIVQVWEKYPRDECYSLLQDFTYTPSNPNYNDQITFSVKKLTNYAPDYDVWESQYEAGLSPRGSLLTFTVTGDADDAFTQSYSANPTNDYYTVTKTWTPTTYGTFNINLIAQAAQGSSCGEGDTASQTLQNTITVNPPPTYTLTFTVRENTALLNGATVQINNQEKTTTNGQAVFNLVEGQYQYTVSKEGYTNNQGSITMNDNKGISVQLTKTVVCGGANLATDENNCGVCGNVCSIDRANEECVQGQCVIQSCETGYVDANNDVSDGCEYQCTVTETTELSCRDNIDNDCDNTVDCNDTNCATSYVCTCTPSTEICDNKDNDCDGSIDEGVTNACGTCGPVPREICDDTAQKDEDCDGQADCFDERYRDMF